MIFKKNKSETYGGNTPKIGKNSSSYPPKGGSGVKETKKQIEININETNYSINIDKLKQIILLSTHEYKGELWGEDTILGTMDELVEKAIEILKK